MRSIVPSPGPIDPTPAYVSPLLTTTTTTAAALDPHVGFRQFRHPVQPPAGGAEEEHEISGHERERRAGCGYEEEQSGDGVGLVGPYNPPQAKNEYLLERRSERIIHNVDDIIIVWSPFVQYLY